MTMKTSSLESVHRRMLRIHAWVITDESYCWAIDEHFLSFHSIITNRALSTHVQPKECFDGPGTFKLKCSGISDSSKIEKVLDKVSGYSFDQVLVSDSNIFANFPYVKASKITWDELVLGLPAVVEFKKNSFCSPIIWMNKVLSKQSSDIELSSRIREKGELPPFTMTPEERRRRISEYLLRKKLKLNKTFHMSH